MRRLALHRVLRVAIAALVTSLVLERTTVAQEATVAQEVVSPPTLSTTARVKALIAEGDRLQYDAEHIERDYRAALARYDEAIAVPDVPARELALAYAQRAGPLLRLGGLTSDVDRKVELYRDGQLSAERAIELDDRCAWCWFWRGACLARWGQAKGTMRSLFALPDLRATFEKAIELDPAHLDARLALAQVDRQVPGLAGGSVERAEAAIRAVLRTDPRFTRAMLDLAELLFETDRAREATTWAQRALDATEPSRPGEHRKFDKARARALLAANEPR